MIDRYPRRLAGWAVADRMCTELIETALLEARRIRGSLAGAIFHSDHGSQYTSKDFAKLCTRLGVTQSMDAVGTSADNALAEAFNAIFKRETLAGTSAWPNAVKRRLIMVCGAGGRGPGWWQGCRGGYWRVRRAA